LRASGLTDETIRDNALYTEHDGHKVAEILNCGPAPRKQVPTFCLAGGLVFPYRDLEGTVNCFARVRPHVPRVRDGQDVKYEHPKGEPPRAYFPAAALPLLQDGESPVYVVEGEKKALACAQLGLAAVGIGGVYSWKPGGAEKLIPDLEAIRWEERTVYIVFDWDPKDSTRRQTADATRRLALLLRGAGAVVYSVELPPGPKQSKQGVDDYLMANSPEDFHALTAQATPCNTIVKIVPIAPPALAAPAYLGFVGNFLRAVSAHTEATDAAVLAHLLPAVGVLLGPRLFHWGGGKQPARVNTMLVGPTNSGRKGTAFVPVDLLMEKVDDKFWATQRVDGLSSGEGLIAYVADKEEKDADGNLTIVPKEKRLYVLEAEFSRVLANIRREGNVLSQVIRSLYDDGNLTTLTVNPRHASGAHGAITGHITPEELKERFA
jgi:hypothetical protein